MQLEKVIFHFTREASDANDLANKQNDDETLKVEYTSCFGLSKDKDLSNDNGGYFILTTEKQGFSFEDEKEVADLLLKIKNQIEPFI